MKLQKLEGTKLEPQPKTPNTRTNKSQLQKKVTSRKFANSNSENNKKIKEITEPEETEENHTDKSTNIINEIKNVTDGKNHVTMTVKIHGSEEKFIVDTGSLVIIIPTDERLTKDQEIFLLTRKHQDVNKNEVKFAGTITVEADSKRVRKKLTTLLTEREDF